MDKTVLKEAWEVIRIDNHDNQFRFGKPMSEEEAKSVESHQNSLGHHQKYFARPCKPDDPNIIG